MMNRRLLFVLTLLLALPFSAPLMAQEEAAAAPDLRIGTLPLLNSVPLYLAEVLGYYEEAGVAVELVPMSSAADLQTALIDGRIDGFQADLVSGLVVNEAGVAVRLVRHIGMIEPALFGIITLQLKSPEELSGASLALSLNTITEYMADQMLTAAGIDLATVEYVDAPVITDRTLMVFRNISPAALMPSPFIEPFKLVGFSVLLDDSEMEYVPEAIIVSADALAEQGEAVRAFLAAYDQGLETINQLQDDDEQRIEVAQRLIDRFWEAYPSQNEQETQMRELIFHPRTVLVPTFDFASVPTEAEFAQVQDWALAAGLVSEARAYEDVVDGSFLPAAMADNGDDGDDGDE